MENTRPTHQHPTTLDRYRTPTTTTNAGAFDFSSDAATPLPQLNLASMTSANRRRPARTPSSLSSVLKGMPGSKATRGGNRGGVRGGGEAGSSPVVRGGNLEVEMDMARMQLISPPPEEVLRRGSGSGVRHTHPTPFTPSHLANASTSHASTQQQQQDDTSPGSAKRKRSLHITPKPSRVLPSHSQHLPSHREGDVVDVDAVDELGQVPHGQGWNQATPNPRLRKQVRRAPLDEDVWEADEDVDVEMASPTKSKTRLKRGAATVVIGGGAEKAKGGNGRGRKTRESPAYEPPPETYIMPIRHTTLSPPPPASSSRKPTTSRKLVAKVPARGKGKGRESIREEMEDEEDGDPLLLSSDLNDGDAYGTRPIEQPGWIIRTPSRTTPKRPLTATTGKAGKSTAKKKKLVRTPGKTPGSTVRRTVTVELESTSVREAVDVVLQEELGEEGEGELGRVLEKRRSVVSGKADLNRKGGPLDFDLPPSSPPPEVSSEGNYDWTGQPGVDVGVAGSEDDSIMHLDPEDEGVAPVPLLDFKAKLGGVTDDWGTDDDSDDDDLGGFGQVEGTGDYTGRWRMLRVRTKEDPPSEATMERMEEWGRPVSPYPGIRRLGGEGEEVRTPPKEEPPALPQEEELERREVGEQGEDNDDELPVAPEEEETRWEEEAARTPRRRTLDVQKMWEDAHLSPPPQFHDTQLEAQRHSPGVLEDVQQHPSSEADGTRDQAPSSEAVDDVHDQQPSSDRSQEEEEEAEEAEVVRLSLEPEDDVPQTAPLLATPKPVYPSPSASHSPEVRQEGGSSPIQQLQTQREIESSPIQVPRQQEVRRPTFPETPRGAFAFESSSPGREEVFEEEYEEEEYLVAIKGSEGDVEFEEEEEMEEDYEEEEEDEMDEEEDEEKEDEDEDDMEEDEEEMDEDEEDVEDEVERSSERGQTFAETPRGVFVQDSSSPAPVSSPAVYAQSNQARRRSSQEKLVHAAPPSFRLDVVPPSSPAQQPAIASSPALQHEASSSPERPQLHKANAPLLPQTPAPRPFQARRVLVEDKWREEEQAEDDEDALEEAIVEELATPKNMKELPYHDHYTPIHRTPIETNEHVSIVRDHVEDGDGGEDSESDLELGMVKIISADPRAAARAAAILKQYDYECYTKLAMTQLKTNEKKRRYSSYSSVDDLSQSSIRRSLLGSGVSKSASRETADRERKRRRSSLGMGVIGDTVIIPGSPRVTLPELLEEVEKEVQRETPSVKRKTLAEREVEQRVDEDVDMETPMKLDARRLKNPLVSPVMARAFETPPALRAWNCPRPEEEERPWTKEEWKVLDSCLTDERLDGVFSPSTADMKPVDAVDVESVVRRFVAMVGGQVVLEQCGEAWSTEMLRQRVKALQKKQRAGNVAPPSTPLSTPTTAANTSISALGGEKRLPSMEVPDFTPLGRRAMPPRRSRLSTESLGANADASFDVAASRAERRKSIPATLLAPRYSHLLDEARAISAEVSGMSMQQDSETQGSGSSTDTQGEPERASEPVTETPKNPQADLSSFKTPNASFRRRLSGIFFSYMPTLTAKTAPPLRRAPREAQPGLPLPPPEVLQKARAVKTPAKVPLPKPVPPKELVELHPPPKPSMIPRWNHGQQPKHLVPLNHFSPPQAQAASSSSIDQAGDSFRPRRGSGASVKDLVKGFEELGARAEEEGRRSRPNSSLSMRSERGMIPAPGTLMGLSRPGWRP